MPEDEFIDLPLLTIPEAAKYLGVGRKIVYQLIERDEIRVVKSKKEAWTNSGNPAA